MNYQTVTLTLADGRQAVYSGPEQISEADAATIVKVSITEGRPMPEGCEWTVLGSRAEVGVDAAKDDDDITAIVRYWNSKDGLQRVNKVTQQRRTKLRARLREPLFRDNWKRIIDTIAAIPFYTGRNEQGWVANIDWFVRNDTGYVRIMERPEFNNCGRKPQGQSMRDKIYEQIAAQRRMKDAKSGTSANPN